jgi:hypothetical protein
MIAPRHPSIRERVQALLADRTLLILLALAFVLRLAGIVFFPSIHHPDENFQLLEQAHRIAFGYGVVPWEFRDGIRSPVLPYALAGIFWVAERIVGGPEGYIIVARAALALVTLIGVAAVYRMGQRTSPTHGLLAGLVAATWFELVYFAPRPLTEAVATTFVLTALALASIERERMSFRRLAAIGFCLSLALMLRVHLAPGIFVAAAYVGGTDLRGRWLAMGLGSTIPLLVFGAADWAYWGAPFFSFVEAVRVNLFDDKASIYGVEPPLFFLQQFVDVWAGALPLMAVLIFLRARASALWVCVALIIIAVHSAIPHKEYRFVVPAYACLAVVAALGSADLIERLRKLAPATGRALVGIGAALWIGTSATLAFAPGYRDNWFEIRGVIEASFTLAHDPDLCGLLFYSDDWPTTGGYTYLHRNVPIYALTDDQDAAKEATEAFNAIILSRQSIEDFSDDFTLVGCSGAEDDDDAVCIMKREGECKPRPDLQVNEMLRRSGE